MKRRGFFAGIAGMITGTAVAQVPEDKKLLELIHVPAPVEPYAELTWDVDGDDRNLHVRLSDGSSVVWHQDGKAYKLVPTNSIMTMPDRQGFSQQFKLRKPVFMLDEVK